MTVAGKELRVTPAPFADALALQKAVGRALRGNKIDLPENLTADLSGGQISGIIDAILSVIVSDDVEECLFRCAQRALLGEQKIDRDFFERVENREHYYPIMYAIAEANLGPFFKVLTSGLGDLVGGAIENLKRKSSSKKGK